MKWKTERRKISQLLPTENNPRRLTESQAEKLRESLSKFDLAEIPAINTDGRILAGHMRLRILRELKGDVEVDVRVPDRKLTKKECQEYLIRSNANTGEWDWDILANEFDVADLDEWGLQSIDEFLPAGEAEAEEDEVPEPPKEARTERGRIYQLGQHRLMCGDSTSAEDVARLLDQDKPMMMVTDPPYGIEYDPTWRADAGINKNKKKMGKVQNDDIADWAPAWRLFGGDVAYVYHAGVMSATVQSSLESVGFNIRAQIIWAKDRMALSRGDYHWQHEPCWYAVRDGGKGWRTEDRKQTTLWQIPARDDDGHGHGTQKPLECMARPIRNHTIEMIYDPFGGSGTTLIACEQTGRKCRMMELDPIYCDVIVRRWCNLVGADAEAIFDGKA